MRNRLLWIFVILAVIGGVLYAVGVRITREHLHISAAAEPVFCLGGTRASLELCASGFPITNALIATIVIDLLLVLTIVFGVRNMQLIPRGFQNFVELMVEGFYNFAQSVDRKNVAKFFPFCATVFFFALYANMFGLLPGVGSIGTCVPEHAAEVTEAQPAEGAEQASEPDFFATWPLACEHGTALVPLLRAPTSDLNVTFAFALVSVFLIELFGFQALGIGYLTKFFNFREGPMMTFVGIIELISELARILSFAFRLFGNIFAGEVILLVMSFLFPYLLPLPFYGLELFVAFIQAVIFAVLSLVFMSLAVQAHAGHDDHGNEAPMPVEAGEAPGVAGH